MLNFFIKPDNHIMIEELHRNDKCYCNSNLKFKNCHAVELHNKKQSAYIVEHIKTKKRSIRIIQNEKAPSIRVKSNLRGNDIGIGST